MIVVCFVDFKADNSVLFVFCILFVRRSLVSLAILIQHRDHSKCCIFDSGIPAVQVRWAYTCVLGKNKGALNYDRYTSFVRTKQGVRWTHVSNLKNYHMGYGFTSHFFVDFKADRFIIFSTLFVRMRHLL